MILTSNRSFGAWGEVFGECMIATAILDRLLHHAVTRNMRGNFARQPAWGVAVKGFSSSW